MDAAENNGESGSRTCITRNTYFYPNHSTTTSLAFFQPNLFSTYICFLYIYNFNFLFYNFN
ncbi:hypothetical protein HanIR_Chr10g0454441 [Helianthus annuus]|nr:hypothetical protein HanIR_Chr10g0454441 [Helianthus annuus]